MSELADDGPLMRYIRMRAPIEHGSVFHLPVASEIDQTWQRNIGLEFLATSLQHVDILELRHLGRAELVQSAIEFTRQHCNPQKPPVNEARIIMAGHQPTLFHAGVWYKNFVLANLGSRFDCYTVNLIVDNDVCNAPAINVPVPAGAGFRSEMIAFDQGGRIVPHEERPIVDHELFDSFAKRVSRAVKPIVNEPIVNRIWPRVQANRRGGNLALAIARGRHQFESEHGLHTLEIPISVLATFESFAIFVREIWSRIEDFVQIHNRTVHTYRSIHKIRSNLHPVPDLRITDGWHETPFWLWQKQDPLRRSLYVKKQSDTIRISDRAQVDLTISDQEFASSFQQLQRDDYRIRPKALMTTMFCRSVLSDMFIHGIGGAKYDQLTDDISRRFFGLDLPGYLTVTATMKIRPDLTTVSKRQIADLTSREREFNFHPERFLDSTDPEIDRIVTRKRDWIAQNLPPGQRLPRHQAIVECNEQLQPFVAAKKTELTAVRKRLATFFSQNRILNSREFSFCLFEESLTRELTTISNCWL